MTPIYLGTYTLLLVVVWGFFIVTKIHAYKFKNFSNNIQKMTIFVMFFLATVSILGYILIFMYGDTNYVENTVNPKQNFEELESITY